MGLGKFLKKVALAPLKATKKTAQIAHKVTTAPAKKLGILPSSKSKPTAAPVAKDESVSKPVQKEKVQKLASNINKKKKPPFFTA